MLVLNRREGEEIIVGDDVIITVVAIGGGTVRLGFTAPDGVRIDRVEVRERVDRDAAGGVVRAPVQRRKPR